MRAPERANLIPMSRPILLGNGVSASLHESGTSLYLRDVRGNLNYIGEAEKGEIYAMVRDDDGTIYVETAQGRAYYSESEGVFWHAWKDG